MTVTITPGNAFGLNNGFAPGSLTVTNLNNGSNYSAGKVVIALVTDDASIPTLPKIGGSGLHLVTNDATGKLQLYYAEVGAGTGDTFTLTNGAEYDKVGVAGWFLAGAQSGNTVNTNISDYPSNGHADPQTVTLTVDAGGGAIAFITSFGAPVVGTITSVAWTNATAGPAMASSAGPNVIVAGAYSTTSGSITPSVSAVGGGTFRFQSGMMAAAWGVPGVGFFGINYYNMQSQGR